MEGSRASIVGATSGFCPKQKRYICQGVLLGFGLAGVEMVLGIVALWIPLFGYLGVYGMIRALD